MTRSPSFLPARGWQFLAVMASIAPLLSAQVREFDSLSDESDGDLILEPRQTPYDGNVVLGTPTSLDPTGGDPLHGRYVYHFRTVHIKEGATLRLGADTLGEGQPVVWLASGEVKIDGVVDLDGKFSTAPGQRAEAGAGGYRGGTERADGNGPGGGRGGVHGGGGAHLRAGVCAFCPGPSLPYGNAHLLPLLGGSGGAGGDADRGGGGGGALLVASSVSIVIAPTGSVSARGGNGTDTSTSIAGGGSGGGLRFVAPMVRPDGRIAVGGGSGRSGAVGSPGRVRIESFVRLNSNVDPSESLSFGPPGLLFLPVTAPRVVVKRIGNVDVPAVVTGGPERPDVTIDANGNVAIEVESTNVPLGTRVRLTVNPDVGNSTTAEVTLQAVPGQPSKGTASATVRLPHGHTRLIVTATW